MGVQTQANKFCDPSLHRIMVGVGGALLSFLPKLEC